ncbi:VOC family protein [Rhizobium binxianense]
MSHQQQSAIRLDDPDRRAILCAAGGIAFGGVASAVAVNTTASAEETPVITRHKSSLGAWLQGVQHFGLMVQNMERAYEFYTEVLDGTEVFRHGDFQGDAVQNTLLTDQEILANQLGVNPQTIGVPDLRGGTQRLDVRFIQFDNVVIELLQYRDADQPMGGPKAFVEPLEHMSPAFPRMMRICFYVQDDVDFNQFIADLEAESVRRGMTQVRANRIIRVSTEDERKAAPAAVYAASEGLDTLVIEAIGPGGHEFAYREPPRIPNGHFRAGSRPASADTGP